MKKSFLIIMAFVLLVCGSVISALEKAPCENYSKAEEIIEYTTEETKDINKICVIGNASLSVKPDKACVWCEIETLDMDMKKSKDDNFAAFDKAMATLKELEINDENITFESFTSYPSYDYTQGKTLTGYYSITTFSFNVDQLDNLQNIISKLSESGITGIRNIQYKISDQNDHYNEVLVMALDNARVKAQKITGRDDLTIKNIKEETVYSNTCLYKTYYEGMSTSFVGNVDLQAKVIVVFE